MGLIPRTPGEILDELMENDTPVTGPELVALCHAAAEGGDTDAKYEALERALAKVGKIICDITTDDDDGIVLEIRDADDS